MTITTLPERFSNPPTPGGTSPWILTTLGAGVATAPAADTQETWTFNSAPSAELIKKGQFRFVVDNEILLDITGAGGTSRTVLRAQEGSTAATHSNGAPVYHILTAEAVQALSLPGPNALLQNGVQNSPDLAVTGVSVASGSGAISYTIAGALPYWILNSFGILVPVYFNGSAGVNVAPPTLPTSTNMLIVGLELDASGVAHLVSGTQIATATGANSATTAGTAGGPPTVAAGRLRIMDIGIKNVSGVYTLQAMNVALSGGSTTVDRRPNARGALWWAIGSGNATTTSTTVASFGDTAFRMEMTGVPVMVSFSAGVYHSVATDWIRVQAILDGVTFGQYREAVPAVAGSTGEVAIVHSFVASTVVAGSHLWDLGWFTQAATATSPSNRRIITVSELVKASFNNGTV